MMPLNISEKFFAEKLTESRRDPRLLEIMTEFMRDYWFVLEPTLLNKLIKKQTDQGVFKAIIHCIIKNCEISDNLRTIFFEWVLIALRGVKIPKTTEILLIEDISPGDVYSKRIIKNSIAEFLENGYYFNVLPFNKGQAKSVKSLDTSAIMLKKSDRIKIQAALALKKKLLVQTKSDISKRVGSNHYTLYKIANHKWVGIKIDIFEKLLVA